MKLEELSIADLKAIHDYSTQELDNIDTIHGYVNNDEDIQYWNDVQDSCLILLNARIKALEL